MIECILFEVTNDSGELKLVRLDKVALKSQGVGSDYRGGIQEAIDKIRNEREVTGQILAWDTRLASEGSVVGIECPSDGRIGKFFVLPLAE